MENIITYIGYEIVDTDSADSKWCVVSVEGRHGWSVVRLVRQRERTMEDKRLGRATVTAWLPDARSWSHGFDDAVHALVAMAVVQVRPAYHLDGWEKDFIRSLVNPRCSECGTRCSTLDKEKKCAAHSLDACARCHILPGADGLCPVCRVDCSEPCPGCKRRGYHADDCGYHVESGPGECGPACTPCLANKILTLVDDDEEVQP